MAFPAPTLFLPDELMIRPVRAGDFDALNALLNAEQGRRASKGHLPKTILRQIENNEDKNFRLVALIKDEMIAQACVRRAARSGHLTIFVREDYRGRGFGSVLLERLLTICAETLDLDRIEVRVLSDNHAAIRLYEKCGFERAPTTDSGGKEALTMVKVLKK